MQVDPALLRQLDETTRLAYIASRDCWASLVEASTAAVVLGCVAEFPEVLHEIRPTLFPERWVRPIKLVATIGLGLVIAGVMGELIFGRNVSAYDGRLQTFTAILLTEAQREIAIAERESAEAGRVAKQLEKDAATQRTIAAEANLQAGKANERAAKLELQAASLQRGLFMQGSRSDALEERATFERFVEKMTHFAGQEVEVRYASAYNGSTNAVDRETYLFAYDVETFLLMARWRTYYPLVTQYNQFSKGIFVSITRRASEKTIIAARAIVDALRAVPIEVNGDPQGDRKIWVENQLSPRSAQPPWYAPLERLPPLDDETIIIAICPHP